MCLKNVLIGVVVIGVNLGCCLGLFLTYAAHSWLGLPLGFLIGLMLIGSPFLYAVLMFRMCSRAHKRPVERGLIADFHEDSVELPLPYALAFKTCHRVVQRDLGAQVELKDHTLGKIEARKGLSLTSFGEMISFKVNEIDAQHSLITVRSEEIMKTRLIGRGPNRKNVERVLAALTPAT
jgi:hypothetical protein